MGIRYDWTVDETMALLTGLWSDLERRAKKMHALFGAQDIQRCKLLSVKTGACPEDCGYCSQSAHYKTDVPVEGLVSPQRVFLEASAARKEGASRFCLGAAWRDIPDDSRFEKILEMIRGVSEMGLEVCCTLGMANQEQLKAMKSAGLTAYNHNLDTSRDFYTKIIQTRTYDDRLNTLRSAREAGVQLCSGGILGMGESNLDRAKLLVELASFEPHPESVPINLLVPIKGTPLENATPVPFEAFLRTVATARILMPRSRVRLSAGRNQLTREEEDKCFSVGANSIFIGEKLLTAPNVSQVRDEGLGSVSTASLQ